MSENNIKNRIIKCLILLKDEIDKRNEIFKYGVDLINYENNYSKVALDIITFNLFLMNKKNKKDEETIREYIGWWLYEEVEKKIWINKKEYSVEKAEDFINFLLEN